MDLILKKKNQKCWQLFVNQEMNVTYMLHNEEIEKWIMVHSYHMIKYFKIMLLKNFILKCPLLLWLVLLSG